MANFCCSIELEPKTLKEGQLNHAREVAVDIVQNKEPTEASSLFIEGLKPVLAVKETTLVMVQEANPHVNKENESKISSCQCSRPSAVIDSPADQSGIKEPLSAPF